MKKFILALLLFYGSAAHAQVLGPGLPSSSAAPNDADYITGASNGTLSAERVATDTATIDVDIGTAGQAKWAVVGDSIGAAQFDETDDYAMTGKVSFTELVLTPVTVATLPASPTNGQLAIITDGATASTCINGEGVFVTICKYNATTAQWELPLSIPGASTPSLQAVSDVGRTINNAVDAATALKAGNGTIHWLLYCDSANRCVFTTDVASDTFFKLFADKSLQVLDSANTELFKVDEATGDVTAATLKTTGAATGKKVVCADAATGKLYLSSTGIDCSN